jgi:phenylpyruvate tautomerase PptA (4-oxalocrotonate tautomerase family)
MSFAVITLPVGYSVEQKRRLLAGVKEACAEGFELGPTHCFSWITELPPENVGEGAEVIKSMVVYTTYGKTVLGKNHITRRFEELCTEIFKEPQSLNIVIFKEHVGENTGARGMIRSLKPLLEKQ